MSRRRGDKKNKGENQIRRSPRLSVCVTSTSPGGKDRQQSKSSACASTATNTNSNSGITKRTRPTTSNKERCLSLLFDHDDDDDDDQDQVDLRLTSANFSYNRRQSKSLEQQQQQRPLDEVDRSAYRDDHSINGEELFGQSKDGQELHDNHGQHDESWLPEKRILELVLDTLQRRDTYEIFAEPVDPNEVEDYYEIIKEPMDFGTMRAKLHEGMYKNLQQFEHDMFLIFDNAMHFNSPATVYFRQAHALEELAKRVFQVLRTDPENFELEFGATKRRSCRKLNELRGSNFESSLKLEKDSSSVKMNTNVGQKGSRRGRKSYMTEHDRRCTYKPWMSLLHEVDSTISPICRGTELLMHAKQHDIGYKESLMLFANDLGPTAQRVVKRKLQGLRKREGSSVDRKDCWHPTSTNRAAANSQNPAAQSFVGREPKQNSDSLILGKTPSSGHSIGANDVMKPKGLNRSREGSQDEGREVGLTRLVDKSMSDGMFDLNQVQVQGVPVSPSPWGCHGMIRDFRSSSTCPSPPEHAALTTTATASGKETGNDITMRPPPQPQPPPPPPPPPPMSGQFTFSLPYLRYRLSQLNESN